MKDKLFSSPDNSEKPVVVFSAVNLTEGGPLSILQDAVHCFVKHFIFDYQLILLVHNRKLIQHFLCDNNAIAIEYSYPKKSWFLRIWFEYIHCYFISKKLKPFLWFALHDMTPNVIAENKILYCHNPAPFYKLTWKEAITEKSLIFFNLFYGLFYRINIRSNKHVIVQQQWMREEFKNRYKIKNIIVSYPDVQINKEVVLSRMETKFFEEDQAFRFFYPALPRVFKNFETLLKAAEILENRCCKFEVILTFNGSENKYSAELIKKYSRLKSVKFVGLKKREDLLKLYHEASCLVFASTMETWGLPITEMKLFNKPVIVAKCKYAYETVGNYKKVCFFDPRNYVQLSELMEKATTGTLQFNSFNSFTPQHPFTNTWQELFSLILSDSPRL